MIVLLALTGLTLLLAALAFVLRDFTRFIWQKTIRQHEKSGFVDYGEYATTWFSVFFIAFSGFIFYKTGTALLSYILSDHLLSFFRIMRGVFTIGSDVQNPFTPSHFIAGLVGQPVLLFLTCWLMHAGLRSFMHWINVKYNKSIYTEGDVLYFGFFAVLLFMAMEIFSYSQEIPLVSSVVHIAYLTVAKLSLICYFLVISHCYLLSSENYRKSLPQYIHLSPGLQKILLNRRLSVFFTLLTGIIMTIPFYIGAQFLENNWMVIGFALVAATLFYKVIRHVLSRGYNYLGAIMFFDSDSEALRIPLANTARISGGVSLAMVLVLLSSPKSLVFLLFFLIPAALHFLAFLGIAYCLGLGLSFLLNHRSAYPGVRRKIVYEYLKISATGLSRSQLPVLATALSAFILFTLFPKKYVNTHEKGYVNRVVDASLHAMVLGVSEGNLCTPASRDELPDFMVRCLYLQEDRDFLEQRSWLPRWSNWHGVSLASLYRMVSGTGGGSNINMQLIKNEAFSGNFPRDFQRKYTEMLASYQLSVQLTPEEIITRYMNEVGMIGGTGHQGAVMAAYSSFRRPLIELNKLEQLYLIASLKRGMSFKTSSGYVSYRMAPEYSEEIKEGLLELAGYWDEKGLLQPGELKELHTLDLRFEHNDPMTGIPISTREFLRKMMPGSAVGGYTFETTLNYDNQLRIRNAINRFNTYFRKEKTKGEFKLTTAALVVEIHSGNILGHYGGEGLTDLSTFAGGNPMGSIIKPFILLELLETGRASSGLTLYDGKIPGKLTPNNYSRKYSNSGKSLNEIISKSLNAPMVNIREITDPLQLYADVEKRFASMKIPPDKFLSLGSADHASENTINYPLGSRNMTLYDIAQAYQVLLNDGQYMELQAFTSVYDPFTLERNKLRQRNIQLYTPENSRIIKEAMHHTMLPGGTGTHISHLLPDARRFYAKTGTSDNAIHGYTVLSDGQLLIVSYVTYSRISGDHLELNETPPIPFESGVRSAGMLAAFIYGEWGHHESQMTNKSVFASK